MALPLEYRVCGSEAGGGNEAGEVVSGRTLQISSSSVEFETDRLLRVGVELDLSIAWPVKLNNATGLTLRVRGRIVRATVGCAELKTERYEFRTRLLYKQATAL